MTRPAVPDDRWVDPLFLINRIVDLIFVTDMTLQFFLMYPKHAHSDNAHIGGGQWVSDMRQIARHNFVSPWFYLDAFSISVSGFDIFTPTGSGASRLKALRAVRVLRLLKLVRLARGSRIFKRWEIRLSINYGASTGSSAWSAAVREHGRIGRHTPRPEQTASLARARRGS